MQLRFTPSTQAETQKESELMSNSQLATLRTIHILIPHGEERLATQRERYDVNQMIELQTFKKTATASPPDGTREAGDQVNRFLLCALVAESSRQIKARAEKAGQSLPMTNIVRGVLRSYNSAAVDKAGPLAGRELDMAGLRCLNEKVLTSEIARHSRDRVSDSRVKLACAERLGDRERIKAERDGLEHAIELQDRFAELFR